MKLTVLPDQPNYAFALSAYSSPVLSLPILSPATLWQQIDDLAIASLYEELNLELKPGLVCPSSQGSHTDMDYSTFLYSIESLRGYFSLMCQHGYANSDFDVLKQAGIAQEAKMRHATQGINTHKGAIFNFGFVCAAIGQCVRRQLPLTTPTICQQIIQNWQYDLFHHLPRQTNSHGQQMYRKYGLTGAIELVGHGFEIVQRTALPCLQHTFQKTKNFDQATTQTLMTLIATLSDTNLAWRGGMTGLTKAQQLAQDFLEKGGVFVADWQNRMADINTLFIEDNFSPGGSADLLGVTLLFFRIENECHHLI